MTWADNYNLRNAAVSFNDVALAADGLAADQNTAIFSGVSNTASAAYVVTSLSLASTALVGEIVEIEAWICVSAGAANVRVECAIHIDGVIASAGFASAWNSVRNDTNGLDAWIMAKAVYIPSTPTHTYALYWKTAAPTAYTARGFMQVLNRAERA